MDIELLAVEKMLDMLLIFACLSPPDEKCFDFWFTIMEVAAAILDLIPLKSSLLA